MNFWDHFLFGVAKAFDLGNTLHKPRRLRSKYNFKRSISYGFQADREALEKDWEQTGKDFEIIMNWEKKK